MAQLIRKKLQAFTLVETLVSMTLISIMIGISFLIFNLSSMNQTADRTAYLVADEIFQKILLGEINPNNQMLTIRDFEVEIKSARYMDQRHLDQLSIRVYKNDKTLYAINHLIINRADYEN